MNRSFPVLGLSVAILATAALLALARSGPSAHAQGEAGGNVAASNGRYLAITGLSRESTETLYLIDTENQILMTYETDRSRGIRLLAVRSFKYDSKILEYHDLSEDGFRASALKERFEKHEE